MKNILNICEESSKSSELNELKMGCEGCNLYAHLKDQWKTECQIIIWHEKLKSFNDCPCTTCLVKVMCDQSCPIFDKYWRFINYKVENSYE